MAFLRSLLLTIIALGICSTALATPPSSIRSLGDALTAFESKDYRRAATLARMAGDRATGLERESARYLEGISLFKVNDFDAAANALRFAAVSADAFVAGQAGVTLGSVEIERKHFDSAGYAFRKAAGFLTGAESQRAHSYAARCFDGAGLTVLADGERVAAGEPPSTPTPILTPAITPATSPAPTMTEPRLRVGPESKPKVAEIAPIHYSIQVGSFSTVEKAHAAAEKLAARCMELRIDAPRVIARENSDGSTLHIVQLGDFENRGVASKMMLKFPRSAFKIEVYLAGIDQSE
ncbi:MAG: SPOR domain-containing protein [Planctomycetota bacterium]